MSVPFSNTHLRVPRGFGTILEGLTREILRDQPEDIPKYAALYFAALLKQREDSGTDPAEWAAKLEDRFYNNHAFKATEVTPEKEPATEVAISKEKSQAEDESSHSAVTSNLSTTQPNVSEEAELTESTEEYEEKHDTTEKHVISMEEGFSEEEELVNVLAAADAQSDDLSGTEEEDEEEEEEDTTMTTFDQVDRTASGKESSTAPDQDIPQSELEPTDLSSFREISHVDVCAQELGTAEDEKGEEDEGAAADEEIVDSGGEENTDVEQPVEALSYSGLAHVDVCATELGGTEGTMEGAAAEDDEGSSKPQPEETVVKSSLSQSETPQHEAEDQVEETKEEEGTETEASSGGIHESVAHIEGALDSDASPKEDSLVEISFEDVPEAQQTEEVEGKQPVEEGSVEEEKISEMQQSEEVAVVETDQNISSTQDHDEPEVMGDEQEVNAEGAGMESQHEASDIMKEKVDVNDSNLNDSDDDEKCEGVKTISSSHQPTSEADTEIPQDETDHKDEDAEKISEGEFHQNEDAEEEVNEPDSKEDETTDTAGGDKEDVHTGGHSEQEDQEYDEGGAENHSPQVQKSNVSATDAECETLEAQHLPEENEESQRTPVESQPEDTEVETEVTSKEKSSEAEELVEEGNPEIQEKSDATCEEDNVNPTQPVGDHQGDERPLGSGEDSTEPGNQEECSRPQEEEDIMDIPLDDPEANRAAAKIQAGFRGHMTRKKMKPEDKAEGEEVSSTGDVLNGSQGDAETGGSGAVERDDTSVPEQ